MTAGRYGYCKIFVRDADTAGVRALVGDLLGGTFEGDWLDVDGLGIEVRANPDAVGEPDPGPEFIWWPVTVEVDAGEGRGAIVRVAATLLRELWERGHPAVVAADFEDELPWGGGIRRLC